MMLFIENLAIIGALGVLAMAVGIFAKAYGRQVTWRRSVALAIGLPVLLIWLEGVVLTGTYPAWFPSELQKAMRLPFRARWQLAYLVLAACPELVELEIRRLRKKGIRVQPRAIGTVGGEYLERLQPTLQPA